MRKIGYLLMSMVVDGPTADDDGIFEAVNFDLCSHTYFKDRASCEAERQSLIEKTIEEFKEDEPDEDFILTEVEDGRDDSKVLKVYYDGDLSVMITYKIVELFDIEKEA